MVLSFSKALVCNQATKNNNFKISFELGVLDNGRVVSVKIIDKPSYLTRDDNKVIDIITIALSKSSFIFTDNNFLNSSKKVKHTVKVPSNFCTS